jgi:cobalt/nickel transport protein
MNKVRLTAFVTGGLLLALLLAGVVSNFASTAPDGLDATAKRGCTTNQAGGVTGGTCIAQSERQHETGRGPLANYGVRGVDNSFLSTGLSGVLGVFLTFAIGGAVFWLVRRRGGAPASAGEAKRASAGEAKRADAAPGKQR